MYLGGFDFPFLMQLMILNNYSSRLEEDPFPSGGGPTADYAFMLFFGAVMLWVRITVAAVANREVAFLSLTVLFAVVIGDRVLHGAPILGLVAHLHDRLRLAFTVIVGGNPIVDIFGVVAGHLYYFLLEVLPTTKGWNLIQTPAFFANLFPSPQGPPHADLLALRLLHKRVLAAVATRGAQDGHLAKSDGKES